MNTYDCGFLKHIFICDDSNEGILTAIYNAFSYRNKSGNDNIGIILRGGGSAELFCEYEETEADDDKVYKTLSCIYDKLGKDIYDSVLLALCHYRSERAYIAFRFLEAAFREGRRVVNMLNMPEVVNFYELSRKTANEAHLFLGFARFSEVKGVLYSEIEPKCNAIPLIADHFAGRFPRENFIIFDKKRDYGVVHGRDKMVMASGGVIREFIGAPDESGEIAAYDVYDGLWKVFFDSIMIKERENYKCQRNLAPLWMRKHMNEFSRD